jgi:hypothetical protein
VSLVSLWHPSGEVGCRVYFWLVLTVHLAVILFVVVLRPFRFRCDNVLFVVGALINSALLLCMVVAMESPRFLTASVATNIGNAQVGYQVVAVCWKLWALYAQLKLVADVPAVFAWTTRRVQLPLEEPAKEPEVVIVDPVAEGSADDDLFLGVLELEATGMSFGLIGDKDKLVTELEDIFARFDTSLSEENDTLC